MFDTVRALPGGLRRRPLQTASTASMAEHCVVLMDDFLPGTGNCKDGFLSCGATLPKLVEGGERIYFEHFWNDFAADKTKSVPDQC